VRPETCRGK